MEFPFERGLWKTTKAENNTCWVSSVTYTRASVGLLELLCSPYSHSTVPPPAQISLPHLTLRAHCLGKKQHEQETGPQSH